MAEYSSKSIEELHFEDYLIMKGGGNTGFGAAPAQNGMTAPTSAFGAPAGFGNTQQTTTGFGGFGATTTSNTGFGAPSTGFGGASGFGAQPSTTGFGAQPTTGFGAQPSTGFGAQPSTGFGAQPSTGFGAQPSSGFGAQPSTTGFGSQTSGFGGFGSTPSTTSSAFGAPASGGFGGSATAAPSSNGFSFGSSATTAPTSSFGSFGASTGSFGATSTTPSFGMGGATTGFGSSTSALSSFGNQTTQNTTLGGFGSSPGLGGAKPTTGGFGTLGSSTGFGAPASAPSSFSFSATPGQPASTAGGFGSLGGGFSGFGTSATSPAAKPTASLGSGFGTSSFNSGFGNFAGATSFGFTPQNTTNLAQGQTVPALPQQPTTPTMDQRIELLVKKKEEIIGSKKPEESESSKQSPSILFAGINSDKSHAITRSSPSSHANILPRGLRSTTSLSKSSASSNTMNALLSPPASKSQLLSSIGSPSPQPSIAGSAKKLVISMGSPLPNSREELPLPPSALSATTQTPLRSNEIEARSTGFSISSAQSHKYSAGEATGLTPSKQHGTPIATPYSSSIRSRGDFDRGSSHSKKKLDLSYSAVDTPSIPVVENDVDRGSMVPVLEKEGYLTSPDISILQKMAPHELARVKNFAVLRPNIGKIEWEGVIDVRGMNIGDIVRIEPKEVFVYENMIEPAEGQGLNRPATITFFGIYPKDRNNKEKVEAYEKKLRSFCEQNDAEFINYDIVSGEWNFAVKHFSRYGLDDSDEEDSTQQSVDQHQGQMEVVGNTTYAFSPTKLSVKESVDTVQQLKSIMMKEQPMDVVSSQTPKKEGLIRSDVESASKTGKAATSNLVTMPWLVVEKVEGTNESPLKTANVVTTVRKSEFALPEQSLDLIALKHKKLEVLQTLGINAKNADAKLYVDSFTKHHTYIVQSVDARKRIGFNVNSTEKLTAGTRKQNAEYFKLAMGRSFRVGWSADGRIVHAGRPGLSKIDQSFGKSQRVIIEQSNTSQWQQYKFGDRQEDNEVAVEQIFQTMLASSRLLHNAVSSELTSQWKVAQGLSFNDEYLHFLSLLKNWQQILRANLPSPQHPRRSLYNVIALIDALYGQEKADWNTSTVQLEDLIPLGEDRESVPEHWERRRLAISKWLEDFTSDEGKPFVFVLCSRISHELYCMDYYSSC